MRLAIDAGNSRVKYGIFNDAELVTVIVHDDLFVEHLEEIIKKYGILYAIIGASRVIPADFKLAFKDFGGIIFDQYTRLPVRNLYRSPESLGIDRLAGAIGGLTAFPWANILVFDFGTALTINFINHKGEFLGGNITPGLHMRLQAMHHFTDKLPLAGLEGEFGLYGMDTQGALRNGAIHGILAEVEYYKTKFTELVSPLKIILTGGNSVFVNHYLKESYVIKPDLVIEGLHEILKINE